MGITINPNTDILMSDGNKVKYTDYQNSYQQSNPQQFQLKDDDIVDWDGHGGVTTYKYWQKQNPGKTLDYSAKINNPNLSVANIDKGMIFDVTGVQNTWDKLTSNQKERYAGTFAQKGVRMEPYYSRNLPKDLTSYGKPVFNKDGIYTPLGNFDNYVEAGGNTVSSQDLQNVLEQANQVISNMQSSGNIQGAETVKKQVETYLASLTGGTAKITESDGTRGAISRYLKSTFAK